MGYLHSPPQFYTTIPPRYPWRKIAPQGGIRYLEVAVREIENGGRTKQFTVFQKPHPASSSGLLYGCTEQGLGLGATCAEAGNGPVQNSSPDRRS